MGLGALVGGHRPNGSGAGNGRGGLAADMRLRRDEGL